MRVSLAQAMAWRLERQFLTSGAPGVTDVVGRLCAVPAWSGDADLAIRRRLSEPSVDVIQHALGDGGLISTFAFRGATHLLTAEDAGVYLAVRSASRQWERRSWQDHYRLQPADWPELRAAVREAVADGPVSHVELVNAVTARPRLQHLRPGLLDASQTLLKPLAWQGDLCFGAMREGHLTFQSPQVSPFWTGLPPLAEAGPRAVLAYLAAYGPATHAHLQYWLVEGLSAGRKRLAAWLDELIGDRVAEIEVGDEHMLHLRDHLDDLAAQAPNDEVVLLPGHDQWVLGAGTSDRRIVPPARRPVVTRGAALVLHAGVVAGTWTTHGTRLEIAWFSESGRPPRAQIQTAAERQARLLDRKHTVTVTVA